MKTLLIIIASVFALAACIPTQEERAVREQVKKELKEHMEFCKKNPQNEKCVNDPSGGGE